MNKKQIIISSILIAIIAELFLFYIIIFNTHKITPLYSPALQVWVNALFNALSAISLIFAIKAIKIKRKTLHIKLISLSLSFSALFLINYIFYHMSVGHVEFNNPSFRTLYLAILITHLLGSVINLPMIFMSVLAGIFKVYDFHKKIARMTYYLWMYVSCSGVIIVLFLKFLHNQQ